MLKEEKINSYEFRQKQIINLTFQMSSIGSNSRLNQLSLNTHPNAPQDFDSKYFEIREVIGNIIILIS